MTNENNNNQVVNIDAQSLQGAQQQGQQMSEQQKQQELQNIRQNTEAKTVVNGKEVPLKEALKAEELFNEQNTQTGINQAHDNSSEAVKAGGFAQNMQQQGMQQNQMQGQQSQIVKQSDVQSGQQELEKHLEQAKQQVQQEEQQAQQQAQQQKQQAGYNIQPKGNVNSKLEEKAQQFNEASPLQPHEEASKEATKQTKAKGQKN
jgi:hypothetical protein